MSRITFFLLILLSVPAYSQTCGTSYGQCILSAPTPNMYLPLSDASTSFVERVSGVSMVPGGAGSILTQQTGVDFLRPQETSASFPLNSYVKAPNSSLGSFEWSTPFTVNFVLPSFNFNRVSTSQTWYMGKGDTVSSSTGYWFYVIWTGASAKPCFFMTAPRSGGTAQIVDCINGFDMVNGPNYMITVTNDGTGSPSCLKILINGQSVGNNYSYNFSNNGFGGVSIVISGSGTGYATSTPFTATGCSGITGTMTSSSGVPASIAFTTNYGCPNSTNPPIVLTAPTGTGAILTATSTNATLINSNPVIISGVLKTGTINNASIAGSPNIVMEDFSLHQGALSQAVIQGLFTFTRFYQSVLGAPPSHASQPWIIWDNDGGNDFDNYHDLRGAIALSSLGYLYLVQLNNSTSNGTCTGTYKQMLTSSGYAHVPVTVPSVTIVDSNGATCSSANLNAYDTSTAQTNAGYTSGVAASRTILVNAIAAGATVLFHEGGSFRLLQDLISSGADSISPLTGPALLSAAHTNVFFQGGCIPCANYTGNETLDYVAGNYVFLNNFGSAWTALSGTGSGMNIYGVGGSVPNIGPGCLNTTIPTEPFALIATSNGNNCSRNGFDFSATFGMINQTYSTALTATPGAISVSLTTHQATGVATPNQLDYPGGFQGSINSAAWTYNSLVNINPWLIRGTMSY